MVKQSAIGAEALPRLEGIGLFALIRRAFAMILERSPMAVVLCLAGIAVSLGGRPIHDAVTAAIGNGAYSPGNLAFLAARALVSSSVAALTLRLFLVPGPRWWRPDRGFAYGVGLLILASFGLIADGMLTIGRVDVHDREALGLHLGLHLALTFSADLVLSGVSAKLLLWPVAMLGRETAVAPGRAWRLMRGYWASYLVAAILHILPFLLPPFLLLPLLAVTLRRSPNLWLEGSRLLVPVASGVAALFEHAMAVVIYRARKSASA